MSTTPPVGPYASAPPEPPGKRSLGKKILIGCGIVALVVAAAFLGFVLYARSRPEMITDFVMGQIESHFAADVTAEDKQELRAAYGEFRKALHERRVSREPINQMRATLVTGGPQNEIHREQVLELTALFRRAVGSPEASPAVSPSASPPSTPAGGAGGLAVQPTPGP